ncbi:diphthamide synthesis protein [Candidatus Woesearchaeota archaeon]|nr:diphthamide synthesis protein [Candidatus Woesearchaeota archaeon]
MEVDLELNRVVNEIKNNKSRSILLQLPDGLKPRAKEIQDRIQKDTNAAVFIWAGSCFGACDIPSVNGIDLLIQFGHSEWR